jgi:hypothetical protein
MSTARRDGSEASATRHWHDLAAIMRSAHFQGAVEDRSIAGAVAAHKSHFFSEKDVHGKVIDYFSAVQGKLQIEPQGAAREALAADDAKMIEDQVMVGDALPFDELMQACAQLALQANSAAEPPKQ